MDVGAVEAPTIRRGQVIQAVTTIDLDIAKSVFQVHGVDAQGNVVFRRQLKVLGTHKRQVYFALTFRSRAMRPNTSLCLRTRAAKSAPHIPTG